MLLAMFCPEAARATILRGPFMDAVRCKGAPSQASSKFQANEAADPNGEGNLRRQQQHHKEETAQRQYRTECFQASAVIFCAL